MLLGTLALQLAQKALGQQARERKVKELDAMATLCRGEHERCKGEVQRLRAQLAERDKERDAALADKESLREQAHAKELLLEQAQARAAGSAPAEPELHEAEKRCQEALVRLGSAEQRALQAQQGLSSVKGECAALQAEVGAISEAFEEVQNQNVRLLEDVQQKDEAATKLMTERLRSDHEAGLLKAERKLLEEKASVAEKLRTSLDELQKSLDEQSKLARDALGKKDEEGRHLQAMVDKHKKDASTAYREAQAAAEQLKTQQKTAQAAADRQSKQVRAVCGITQRAYAYCAHAHMPRTCSCSTDTLCAHAGVEVKRRVDAGQAAAAAEGRAAAKGNPAHRVRRRRWRRRGEQRGR